MMDSLDPRSEIRMCDGYLSFEQAVLESGYSEATIRRAIRHGLLKRVRNGVRRIKIKREDLAAWMRGGCSKGVRA